MVTKWIDLVSVCSSRHWISREGPDSPFNPPKTFHSQFRIIRSFLSPRFS